MFIWIRCSFLSSFSLRFLAWRSVSGVSNISPSLSFFKRTCPCLALFVCVKFSLKGDQREQEGFVIGEWPNDPKADYLSLTGDSVYPNYQGDLSLLDPKRQARNAELNRLVALQVKTLCPHIFLKRLPSNHSSASVDKCFRFWYVVHWYFFKKRKTLLKDYFQRFRSLTFYVSFH